MSNNQKTPASPDVYVDPVSQATSAPYTGMPPILPGKAPANPYDKYRVRFLKASLSDAVDTLRLEEIMTKGIHSGGEIVLLETSNFTFQCEYFIVLKYLERV